MKVERAAGWILLGLLLVVPTVWMVGYALLYSLGLLGLLSSGLTAEWWRQALSGAVLWHSLLLSLGVASVTTLACLVAGLAVCVAADRWRVQRAVGVLLTIGAACRFRWGRLWCCRCAVGVVCCRECWRW